MSLALNGLRNPHPCTPPVMPLLFLSRLTLSAETKKRKETDQPHNVLKSTLYFKFTGTLTDGPFEKIGKCVMGNVQEGKILMSSRNMDDPLRFREPP